MWQVLIEWDGRKPPTTFYNRVKRIAGFHVGKRRKDSTSFEDSPLQRRVNLAGRNTVSTDRVVFQEGVFLCKSEQLAHEVYQIALGEGAQTVELYHAEPKEFKLSAEDQHIHDAIEDKLGRRGRPAGPKETWVCTCLEEAISSQVEEAYHVVSCPSCGCPKIRSRPGELSPLALPDGDVVEAWKRNRFASGLFEVPVDGENSPPATALLADMKEAETVRTIENSPDFLAVLKNMRRKTACAILDAVFASRTYLSADALREARMRVCVDLYANNVEPTEISFMEKRDRVDLLDAASIETPKVAAMWLQYCRSKGV